MQPTLFETKKLTQAERILELLEKAGPEGVTNVELNQKVCFRYSARIMDLRQDGHEIAMIHVKGPVYRYVLEAK